jgi:hypothetical protein
VLSQTTKIPDFRGFSLSKSPLTDSNRRPPPYHRHTRTRAITRDTVLLQIGLLKALEMRREASRVSFLMCPFCVRRMLLK